MGLLSKIKSALFEEEQEEPAIAKKIDVEKSIEEDKVPIKHYEDDTISTFDHPREEKRTTPIIFDVEDFIEESKEPVYEKPKHENKMIYGGYETKKEEKIISEEKFVPTPVISPVYGILDKNYIPEKPKKVERKSLDSLFADERKESIDIESVRRKAYGDIVQPKEEQEIIEEPEEENSLLYEMQTLEDKPGIEKISLGDAEEYFEDLGLEYDVDYTDLAKEKMTRAKKNKQLTKEVEETIQEDELVEETNDEIPEEKNLYDLIDMMYDNKE